ncbi:MAG: nucleotidyltransferase domain-containing protein [Acholeplasmatales bacterium]|nr:nucleotidyltransferase domain-containing protein [Acholeplasmatales bacterium]
MILKEIRISKKITQKEAANILLVSLRSYKDYENNPVKHNSIKYNYMCEKLYNYNLIDEEHGILILEDIKNIVKTVCDNYKVNFCYLFGSYAKNTAGDKSDVDLLIDTEVTGLDFYGLVEELRVELHKKVDLITVNQLDNNQELLKEILKDGIKIYG